MNLSEWKQLTIEGMRNQIKSSLMEGKEPEGRFLSNFSDEEMAEIREEIEIESFCEEVDFEDEIELIEETEGGEELQEILEFVVDQNGTLMDVELEIDTVLYDLNEEVLNQIRDVFFAESYEVMFEAAGKAKVVFRRSAGKITKRKKCGKGMSLKGNRCIPQTGSKKAKNRIRGIKIRRAKKSIGGGMKKKAALKARITKRRVAGRARNYAGIK